MGFVWKNLVMIRPHSFVCGHCGNQVASRDGFITERLIDDGVPTVTYDAYSDARAITLGYPVVIICPNCTLPTIFYDEEWRIQIPSQLPGRNVNNLPDDINEVYQEIRRAFGSGAPTASMMVCRKMIVHLVARDTKKSLTFKQSIDHLKEEGYIPPGSDKWLNRIRETGNEANHETIMVSPAETEEMITFLEMLLRFMFEYPGRMKELEGHQDSGESEVDVK